MKYYVFLMYCVEQSCLLPQIFSSKELCAAMPAHEADFSGTKKECEAFYDEYLEYLEQQINENSVIKE